MNQPADQDQVDRLELAKHRLLELLGEQLALVKPEAIARLGEGYHRGDTRNIDPHITGVALGELDAGGKIVIESPQPTRGGASVATIQPADQRKRTTAINASASRKRLLYARYLGWASGTQRSPHGLIGPAGEQAVRRAIVDSTALQPAAPGAGPVSEILNVKLNGAADSGAFMNPLIDGIPQPPVTVLIEVKSIREWIYPDASELFQVLHKCLLLKRVHPDVPVVPILICRRAHKTAFFMAKQLGFIIIEMAAQFVGTTVAEDQLLQVRNELGVRRPLSRHRPQPAGPRPAARTPRPVPPAVRRYLDRDRSRSGHPRHPEPAPQQVVPDRAAHAHERTPQRQPSQQQPWRVVTGPPAQLAL